MSSRAGFFCLGGSVRPAWAGVAGFIFILCVLVFGLMELEVWQACLLSLCVSILSVGLVWILCSPTAAQFSPFAKDVRGVLEETKEEREQ